MQKEDKSLKISKNCFEMLQTLRKHTKWTPKNDLDKEMDCVEEIIQQRIRKKTKDFSNKLDVPQNLTL